MKSLKIIGVIAVVALIIAIIALFTPVGKQVVQGFGGVTNYDEVDTTALKVGGSNGTRVGPIITGQGALIYSDGSAGSTVASSSTKFFDIAVTGEVVGDYVFVQSATSTVTIGGWSIIGATASTSNGFITVGVYNGSNATGNIPRSIASSTTYLVFHPVTSVPGL